MAKLAGSLWVEGDYLHYVDSNAAEWIATVASASATPAAGAKPGSVWIESTTGYLCYVTESGALIYKFTQYPGPIQAAAANAINGSIWIESNLIRFVFQPYEYGLHYDVAPVSGHGDIAHVDAGAHTDTPHTNTHTDSHGDQAHSDRAHTDHNDHNDNAHVDSHSDSHGDNSHQDSHNDDSGEYFYDHVDCSRQYTHNDSGGGGLRVHFDCNSSPGGYTHTDITHLDSGGDNSNPIHYDHSNHDDVDHTDEHTNVAHTNTHSDTAHGDTIHYDHQDHQDISHLDSHDDSHSNVAHQDVAHGDSGTHSDTPHTNTHTDTPHIDSPVYVGP